MNRHYRKVDIQILNDFMDGEEHDVYLLVKKLCFRDMYMSLYEYSFKNLTEDDDLDTFSLTAFNTYRAQNRLNQCLKVRDGKYYDEFLIGCVTGEVYQRFPNAKCLEGISKFDFMKLIIEKEKNYLDNILTNEYNIDFLISLLKDKFGNDNPTNIKDVIDYIYEISNKETIVEKEISFEDYINKLIAESNLTLNQLGNESLIKKGIYELNTEKIPTKNNLIMLSFALRLSKEKRLKLFDLAKEKVKYKSNSNMYNFDVSNKRDKLILHWLDNIEELDNISKDKNKYIVEVFNKILKSAGFDILK